MELPPIQSYNFGNSEIKTPPQTEFQKQQAEKETGIRNIAKLGPTVNPALGAAEAYEKSKQRDANHVIINNGEIKINGQEVTSEEAKQYGIHIGDHVGNISVNVGGNINGIISTGGNDIPGPTFPDDDAMIAPDFDNRSVNIHPGGVFNGNVNRSNLVMGNVGGDVNYNDPTRQAYVPKYTETTPDQNVDWTKYHVPDYNGSNEARRDFGTYIVPKAQVEYVNKQDSNYNQQEIRNPWGDTNETPLRMPQYGSSELYPSDEMFYRMLKKWQEEIGSLEPIPKAEPDLANQGAIIEVIDRNWNTKYANYKARKANFEPEVKQVLRKRDKIRNVLKNVGNRIADKLKQWSKELNTNADEDFEEIASTNYNNDINPFKNYPNEDLNYDLYNDEEELNTDPEAVRKSRDLINNIQVTSRPIKEKKIHAPEFASNQNVELITDQVEVAKRRKRIEDMTVSSKTSAWKEDLDPDPNAGWKKPEQDQTLSPEVITARANLESIQVTSRPIKKQNNPSFETTAESKTSSNLESNIDNIPEIINIADQEEFVKTRLNALDKLSKIEELTKEIENIQNGTFAIPDAIADESDYEGTDEEVTEKLNKNKEYTDARDLNMKKTYEILSALKQKRDLVKEVQEVQAKSDVYYDSYQFTIYQKDGKKIPQLKNDPKRELTMETTQDGKLKLREPDGKEYVVTDYENKAKNQKAEQAAKLIEEEMISIKYNLQKKFDYL